MNWYVNGGNKEKLTNLRSHWGSQLGVGGGHGDGPDKEDRNECMPPTALSED